jgi:hypothetical protein
LPSDDFWIVWLLEGSYIKGHTIITDIIREWIIRRPSTGSDNCAAEGEKTAKIKKAYSHVKYRMYIT